MALKTFLDGVHTAPDEGGGGGADAAPVSDGGDAGGESGGDSFTVGEEKLTREEAQKRLENYHNMQKGFTEAKQSAAEVKRLEGRLEELARQQTAATTKEPEPEAPNFDQEWEALDPYADDYKSKSADLRRREREWDKAEIKREIAAVEQRTGQRASAGDRATSIERHNDDLFNRSLADKDLIPVNLTADEKAAFRASFDSQVGDANGEYDAGARRMRRNETAVQSALWSVPSIREKLVAARTAAARDEAARGRAAGEAAGRSAPGNTSPAPRSNAPFEEQWAHYSTLNESGRRSFRKANPKFRDEALARREAARRDSV